MIRAAPVATKDDRKLPQKAYASPQLFLYGDIRAMTESSGTLSKNRDTIGGPPNKTA